MALETILERGLNFQQNEIKILTTSLCYYITLQSCVKYSTKKCHYLNAELMRKHSRIVLKQNYTHNITFWAVYLQYALSGVARVLLRGGGFPKFMVTKSSRSESHPALGLKKRLWLQQPATVTVISALICVIGPWVLTKIDLTYFKSQIVQFTLTPSDEILGCWKWCDTDIFVPKYQRYQYICLLYTSPSPRD